MPNTIAGNSSIPTQRINCVGLFGTCAGSVWREPFKEVFRSAGIDFFDPQVMPETHGREWCEEDIPREKAHLRYDSVILFPVLGESDGLGSLSEVGLSILHAIRLDESRDVVVMIDPKMDEAVATHPDIRKRSNSARGLVRGHLTEMDFPNVTVVRSMKDMLDACLQLVKINKMRLAVREAFHRP